MSQRLPAFVLWPRGERLVGWGPRNRRITRAVGAMMLMVVMAFAARWIFGSDSLSAILMLGIGLAVMIVALLWWSYWTDERVTAVEFNRRSAVETLATPLWQHVAFFLAQMNCSVIAALAITIEGDIEVRDVVGIAQILLMVLPVLTVVAIGVSLWGRRLAKSLLAHIETAEA